MDGCIKLGPRLSVRPTYKATGDMSRFQIFLSAFSNQYAIAILLSCCHFGHI